MRGKEHRFIYISAGILVPLSILAFGLLLGGKPPLRALFVLPFAFGFMFYFIISRSQNPLFARAFTVLAFFVALHFSQISSSLFYSDSQRFSQDVFLARQIDLEIQKIAENKNESRVITFIGKREPQRSANFLRGEVIGFSHFEFGANGFFESSERAIFFMQSLGMDYEFPNSSQMQTARLIQSEMPSFPQAGSIIDLGDFIVVKLSESVFETPKQGGAF